MSSFNDNPNDLKIIIFKSLVEGGGIVVEEDVYTYRRIYERVKD